MATTTFSEITDIVEYLNAHADGRYGKKMHLPIREIDGIKCEAFMDSYTVNPGLETSYVEVRFQILATYKNHCLLHKMFSKNPTHEEIVAFIKTVRVMKYCKTAGQLCIGPAEFTEELANPSHAVGKLYYERKFTQELFNPHGEACCYKTDHGECPVCLDTCYTILSCGHHLCLQCESKMEKKVCPQCRDAYCRFDMSHEEGDY
jgi:hypothetical protein